MKYLYFIIIFSLILSSCTSNSNLVYLNGSNNNNFDKIDYSMLNNSIEFGDILKIDIQTIVPEAAIPYNNSNSNQLASKSIDILKLEGYLVNDKLMINYPILGEISTQGLNISQLENKITKLLLDGKHLTNHTVNIRRINSKFTVLGEVRNPSTYSYFDDKLNVLQAIGYAGDLTILGKRKDITIIREENGLRKIQKIDLTKSDFLLNPYYQIKNNDIIIVNPNYSKVKSAGFIGSPSSITSLSSLILSITLLIINQ